MDSQTIGRQPDGSTGAGPIVNIAAYKFVEMNRLEVLRGELKRECHSLGLRGTILLSGEGINLFLAGSREAVDRIMGRLRALPGLSDLEVKESFSDQQPFNRMLVKIKREIIAFGVDGIAPARRTSTKLPARQLKAWLDEGRPVRLMDVRNDYEIDLGTFRGAERLGIHHFRDFPEATEGLSEEAKNAPLVMFCTGGIRCEKAGPLMERLGFREVYQLEGGILKYFEECGGAHYEGGCFVFDSRVVLDPDLKPTGAIQCYGCQSVLTHEDVQSPKFRFGKCCPHCYRTPQEEIELGLSKRQRRLDSVARDLAGCRPYDNRRVMHVPARMAGASLIEFLGGFHPPTPRDNWLVWIGEGAITSDGQPVRADQIVREGQAFVQVEPNFVEPPVATDIRILFEDEALVVVDKPAPLPVHPSGRFNRNTLLAFLSEVYRPEKLRAAHRLDANTTGLIVFCRKYSSARVLQPQFSTGAVEKTYLLQVLGHPEWDRHECDAAISEEPGGSGGRGIDPAGQSARTEFRLLERRSDGTSILEAVPITGRTNQIRVHAWHLGLPIVGDPLYLPDGRIGSQQTLSVGELPMHLHAWKLSFPHPFSGQAMAWVSPPPVWTRVEPR